MRTSTKAVIGILFVCAAALIALPSFSVARGQSAAPASLIRQSDDLYAERADLAKARAALAKLEAAVAANEDPYGAHWRMARLSYWIGDHTAGNDAKKPIFLQGIEHAKKAIELGPDKPDGHFWLGVCYGVYGEAKGVRGLAAGLARSKALTENALKELRIIIHDLRPSILDDLGLVPAVRRFAEERLEPLDLSVSLETRAWPKERLPSAVETVLFRVMQEAINNVARHAEACRVLIVLETDADELVGAGLRLF